jgi:hypothetical protein
MTTKNPTPSAEEKEYILCNDPICEGEELAKLCESQQKRIEELEEALGYYANEDNWKSENVDTEEECFSFTWIQDDWKIAKAALNYHSSHDTI